MLNVIRAVCQVVPVSRRKFLPLFLFQIKGSDIGVLRHTVNIGRCFTTDSNSTVPVEPNFVAFVVLDHG